MQQGALPLDALDLALSASLVLLSGAVSAALRLGLGRQLAVASVRTVLQLLMVGYVLQWVFALERAPLVFAVMGVMLVAAGRAAVKRSKRGYAGDAADAVLTLALTGLLTTFTVTAGIVGVDPWFDPQYVIPLMGMVLGNSLTGVSLCLDSLLESFTERAPLVEADLALGASRWEAARQPLGEAVRRGMVPMLNAMTVVGLVSLPGMMTGQILEGADPLAAVRYQVMVMFMLAAATALGSVGIGLLAVRRMFDDAHRLRSERVHARGG